MSAAVVNNAGSRKLRFIRAVPFARGGSLHSDEPAARVPPWILQELWSYCSTHDVEKGPQSGGYVFDVRAGAINMWHSHSSDRAMDGTSSTL